MRAEIEEVGSQRDLTRLRLATQAAGLLGGRPERLPSRQAPGKWVAGRRGSGAGKPEPNLVGGSVEE